MLNFSKDCYSKHINIEMIRVFNDLKKKNKNLTFWKHIIRVEQRYFCVRFFL